MNILLDILDMILITEGKYIKILTHSGLIISLESMNCDLYIQKKELEMVSLDLGYRRKS